LLIALLAAATVQDAVQLRISNLITAAVVLLGIAAMGLSGFQPIVWQNSLAFAAVLLAGAILFSQGMLGGGDVKLLAAVALWVDARAAPMLVLAILICGGLLAVLILFLRVALPERLSGRVATLRPKAGIPYGIAISVGTLMALAAFRHW